MDHQLAKAKVNLALHVIGKKQNGFHELDSLVCFPQFGDQVTCRRSSVSSLSISGDFSNKISVSGNLILKTLRKITTTNKSLSVHLEKNIPLSAGLGGGSADAAAVIRSYVKLWGKLNLNTTDISNLGADVPVCMKSSFQNMQGIGQKIYQLKSKLSFHILLVNSGYPISTKEVFSKINCTNNSKLEKLSKFDNLDQLIKYLNRQRNDLEVAAQVVDPNLSSIKDYVRKICGCKLVRISGSGGTVFGIFESRLEVLEACRRLNLERKGWWAISSLVNLADSGYDIAT